MTLHRLTRHSLHAVTLVAATLSAQVPTPPGQTTAPRILKIDPPNWWAQFPEPMLLVQGENLTGATASLSDPHLTLKSTRLSPNGHWLELWLATTPAAPETVTLTIKTPHGTTSAPYKFDQKRGANDGFAGFSPADVLYLIMTDRFANGDLTNDGTPTQHAAELARQRGWHGGDLKGIQQHINYLQDLGITAVWITPVDQNHGPESYHGYGATDMYAVDQHFGSLDDLRSLSRDLHQHGIKLVLDTVPNHVGATHPWVYDAPETAWFHGTPALHTTAQGDFKPLTDPHAPWRDQRNVTEGWFANVLPDLNQENPAVSKYLIQNTIWWTEQAGLDGLRLDTFPYIARPFWQSFHAQLHTLFPHLTTVGEIFNSDPTITSTFAGGITRNGIDTGLDTPFDFPTYFALRSVLLHDAPMTKLAEVLRQDALYPHPERLVPFLGNHDTTRFLNDPSATPAKLQLAFTVLTTMRGMPQIYSGDEIAMRGGEDPDNRRDFPGGFPGSFPNSDAMPQQNAFTPTGRTPEQEQTFHHLQTLLTIRHAHPALQGGDEQILHADADTLVYVRTAKASSGPGERILVAINKGPTAATMPLNLEGTALNQAQSSAILLGTSDILSLNSNQLTVRIPPGAAVIAQIN